MNTVYIGQQQFYGGNRRSRAANDGARFQTRLIRMEALIGSAIPTKCNKTLAIDHDEFSNN